MDTTTLTDFLTIKLFFTTKLRTHSISELLVLDSINENNMSEQMGQIKASQDDIAKWLLDYADQFPKQEHNNFLNIIGYCEHIAFSYFQYNTIATNHTLKRMHQQFKSDNTTSVAEEKFLRYLCQMFFGHTNLALVEKKNINNLLKLLNFGNDPAVKINIENTLPDNLKLGARIKYDNTYELLFDLQLVNELPIMQVGPSDQAHALAADQLMKMKNSLPAFSVFFSSINEESQLKKALQLAKYLQDFKFVVKFDDLTYENLKNNKKFAKYMSVFTAGSNVS